MIIVSTKYAILMAFHQIMAHHKKTYCWPTREKIQELILKKKNRLYSLSWIDDCLGWLKVNRYIVSYRNYGRYDNGTIYAKASNRQLTRKALATLRKGGLEVARWLWGTAKKINGLIDSKTATQDNIPKDQDIDPPRYGKNPFLDPEFRKRKGLKPLPLWKVQKP